MNLKEEFIKRHGGMREAMKDIDASGKWTYWWVFSDGAIMEDDQYGAIVEPPADPIHRLRIIIGYREKKLANAEAGFEEFKRSVLAAFDEEFRKQYIGYLFMGTEEAAEQELKTRQQQVATLRKELEAVKKEREDLIEPPARKREREAVDTRVNERKQRFIETVRKTKV